MELNTHEKQMRILFSAVMKCAREMAEQKLPVSGKFRKFGVTFSFPDGLYKGFLMIDNGLESEKRIANISVYPADSDRALTNFLFFDSTQEVIDWLGAEESLAELIQTVQHLREKSERMD